MKSKQLEFNFEKSRQLEIPFPMWLSENQEKLEDAKERARSKDVSEAERRDALAEVERLKQTLVTPSI